MYVWAWRENDPYRVAWTLIRQLRKKTTQYPITEQTHQGVKLVIEDENDLAQYIPGDPGELFDEPECGLVTQGIVLQMGPAGAIMGRVTDTSGASVANATVRIEEFTLGLGMSTLTVDNLDHEWKADVSTVTDAQGYYQLSNLPISWTSVRLRAVLEDYGAGQAEYEGTGLSMVRGCDVQLTEGQSQETSETQDDDDDQDAPYRGELTSEPLRDLPFSLPQGPLEARIEPVQARGEVSVTQLPSQENDHELVVRFDDSSEGASDWYEITLYVGSTGGLPTEEFGIGVKAYIDGISDLVFSQNTVYWNHLHYVAPGLHEGHNDPTYINDIEWFPEWSEPAEPEDGSVEVLAGAVSGFALSSSSDDSSEDNDDQDQNSEPSPLLSGSLIDERGNAVAGARVFGSYAQHATTDSNGSFALDISPEDGSNSAGPADFPMYVWAYEENDPYRVAWTVIRNPDSDSQIIELDSEGGGTQVIEETHQGVKLVVEDENDLAQYVPGDPGRLEDPDGSPTVHDIVLVMGPATVITGRVTGADGSAVAGATVSIDQLQMQLGTSSLTVSELDHDWKAEAFAVTDAQGYYQLNNLPASWTTIELEAEADGYATAQQEFQNAGGNKLDGCDMQLGQLLMEGP
jgi:protocatechuate 3,4-dioxygenase beta subunit